MKQHLKANQKCQPLVKVNKLENPKHKYNEYWMDEELMEGFHKRRMNHEDTTTSLTHSIRYRNTDNEYVELQDLQIVIVNERFKSGEEDMSSKVTQIPDKE